MKKRTRQTWFDGIGERIHIRNIADMFMYRGGSLMPSENFITCEENAEKKLQQDLENIKCTDKQVLEAFESYGDILKQSYFELGVVIGICMAAEILLKENGI